ncbi:MAG: hypothetical protein CMP53_09130 [Flavobacteriales bacterium]|nr:hypothetical protein [Flavobacteriales bacterium]
MFKIIKKLKNKLTRKQTKKYGPKPLAYSSIWTRVIAMDAAGRDAAFSQGFVLAVRGSPGAQFLTGHRLMEVISMVNICIDVMNGDEAEGLKLAKEQMEDYYMEEAEGKYEAKVLEMIEEE